MTVKEHYDNHLGNFYSWMVGDFDEKEQSQEMFFRKYGISSQSAGVAVDLGAGNGIQTIALAKSGFEVKAVDFNPQLLNELKERSYGLNIEVIEDDLRNVTRFKGNKPQLIVCCGDTLTHLDSKTEVEKLILDCAKVLVENGKLVLTFRDYSSELTGESRFIPVKSDKERILTCFLEYFPEFVCVTDLLHELENGVWVQKVSSYKKIRISTSFVISVLQNSGFKISLNEVINRMTTIIAVKER